jgi:hypothetical protein
MRVGDKIKVTYRNNFYNRIGIVKGFREDYSGKIATLRLEGYLMDIRLYTWKLTVIKKKPRLISYWK